MAVARYIKRRNYSSSGKEEVESGTLDVSLEKIVYKLLGDLTNNKTLERPTEIKTKYDRWLVDMDNYSNGLIEPTQALLDLDEYLGALGITAEYPFKEDVFDSEPWVDIETRDPYRNLAQLDVNGDIESNIYDEISDSNIIHNTGV